MGCCIAVALIIALVRTAWLRLFRGGQPARPGFAPPATRPAPGTGRAPYPPTQGMVEVVEPGRAPRPLPTPVLAALATLVGAGLYAELLAVLARTGAVVADTGAPVWRLREAGLIGAGIAAAVATLVLRAHRTGGARHVGVALLAAGGAWALVSVLDMHLTGLVPADHVGPVADLALHGPGLLALTAGGLLTGSQRIPSYPGATS